MKIRVRRALKMAGIAVVVLVLLGGLASWYVGSWLMQAAPKTVGALAEELNGQSIQVDSASGQQLAGWHLVSEQNKGVVVLLHGIRGSRLAMLKRARFLVAAGYSVVMIDLQSHGESTGQRITLGHLEKHDAAAAVQYAKKQHPAESVFVIGVSLGGASALLASPLGVDAMVVESVFSSVQRAVKNRVAERLGPLADLPSWLLLIQLKPRLATSPDQLRPIDRIAECGCPILVMSGDRDPYTPANETREMFEAASEPKELWLLEGATHTDLHSYDADEYERRVLQFLEAHSRS